MEFRLSSAQLRAWAEALTPKSQNKATPTLITSIGDGSSGGSGGGSGGDGGGSGGGGGNGGGAGDNKGGGKKNERPKTYGKLKTAASVSGDAGVAGAPGAAAGVGADNDVRGEGGGGDDEGGEGEGGEKGGPRSTEDDGLSLGIGGTGGPPEVGIASKTKGRFASQVGSTRRTFRDRGEGWSNGVCELVE